MLAQIVRGKQLGGRTSQAVGRATGHTREKGNGGAREHKHRVRWSPGHT